MYFVILIISIQLRKKDILFVCLVYEKKVIMNIFRICAMWNLLHENTKEQIGIVREFFMRVVGQRSVKKLGKPSIDFRRLLSVSHKKVSQKISIYKHLQFFLQHIPMPVLYGVFFYMGASALSGMQVTANLLIYFDLRTPQYFHK